tara:strand:+ start:262 stop:879 length:618 start_codon:yes stop_codon:yes gene_type:complete
MAIRTAVNRALTAITALPTAAALVDGNLTLLTTATASSSATLDFTSSIDSTYDSYMFKFYDMHPANDQVDFMFNFSTDGGSNYNVAKTSTQIIAYNHEGGAGQGLQYNANQDIAQGTGFDFVVSDVGNANDEAGSGSITLFNPSSTTFVKHYLIRGVIGNGAYAQDELKGGYGNTTSAINAVQFKFISGNIDAGVIKMYGVGPKQ